MIYTIVILTLIAVYTYYTGHLDGSNAVATTIATRSIKPRTAIILGAIVHFIAAIVMYVVVGDNGLSVAATVGNDMVDTSTNASLQSGFIFIFSGLVSAIIWGAITHLFKLPNSTSHTLLGGIIGAGIGAFGIKSIFWENVMIRIVLMIFIAPIISVIIGYIINKLLRKAALRAPMATSKIVIALQWINIVLLSASFSINNIQKSIGIYFLFSSLGFSALPGFHTIYIVIIFAFMLALGMLLGGNKIIITVGQKLFKLKPIHSLSSQIATNAVILTATFTGIPISTGQVISSSVVGIGISEKASNVNWKTVRKIVIGWIATMPITILLGWIIYLLINAISIIC